MLSMAQMMRADELSTMRSYSKGQVLSVGANRGADVAIIKDGMVKVQRLLRSGDVATIDIVGQGELIGRLEHREGAVLEVNPETIIAMDGVVACEFQRQAFIDFMREVPAFSEHLASNMQSRMLRMSDRLVDLVFKSAESRIASFLLRQGEQFGSIRLRTLFVPTGITHAEIGRIVGLSRQTVAEVLNELKRAGIIDMNRRQIMVLDIARLREIGEQIGREIF